MERAEIIQCIRGEVAKCHKRISTILQEISETAYERDVNAKVLSGVPKTITQEIRDKALIRKLKSLTRQSVTEYEKRKVLEEVLIKILQKQEPKLTIPIEPVQEMTPSIAADIISRKMDDIIQDKDQLAAALGEPSDAGSSTENVMRQIHDKQIAYATLLELLSEIKHL